MSDQLKQLISNLVFGVDENISLAESLFHELAEKTADIDGGITRASYGEGEQFAHKLLAEAARKLNLEVFSDVAGNTYMTLPGKNRDAHPLITGSHLDSQPKAGNYDGAAGVISGLVALAGIKCAGITPAQDITLMACRGEENGHVGSRAALGILNENELKKKSRVFPKRTIEELMIECGFDPATIEQSPPYLKSERIKGFIELHIEQGPILEAEDLPIGIVTGIRGNVRAYHASCIGAYNHSGGMPHNYRQDAVLATVEFLFKMDRACEKIRNDGEDLVFTAGKLYTNPKFHVITKIPGEVFFTLDIRSASEVILNQMRSLAMNLSEEIGSRRRVKFDFGDFPFKKPALMDEKMYNHLHKCCQELNIPTMDIASGGGHDAAEFAHSGVPTSMIFIRNSHGSHNPEESIEMEDFKLCARLLAWMLITIK